MSVLLPKASPGTSVAPDTWWTFSTHPLTKGMSARRDEHVKVTQQCPMEEKGPFVTQLQVIGLGHATPRYGMLAHSVFKLKEPEATAEVEKSL